MTTKNVLAKKKRMKIKMENLLDIKKALEKVPDEILGSLYFGIGEGCEETVSILASEGSDEFEFPKIFEILAKKYPEVLKVDKLIKNIAKAQVIISEQGKEYDELEDSLWENGIDSETF